ncbi:ly6/PLAUR domain-containing protein 3 [Microcaecilia unicolor]|uniref:Ly6/PLAUR domain-containing protein 3-like n=1 Tax=Microcaecilia unicolor TaxID=1415580 RepID=A0A6P7YTV2_9AMPH|nr:ly6/PLAUR domain-containing protein 3-like [Microcaecilia unicolor]
MEGELWPRGKALGILLVCALTSQGVQPDVPNALECYSCVDQGDHGCSMEKAMKVKCQEEENVCMETVYTMQTSHDTYTVAMKACGTGELGKMNQTLPYHGLNFFIEMQYCNTSLCNAEIDLEKYQHLPSDNSSSNASRQCYSCIGKKPGQCLPSNAPVLNCHHMESYCFDGNATITINNITQNLPIKSCSTSPVCAKVSRTWGDDSFTMLGGCCSENKCNQNLQKKIQYGDPPLLLLMPNDPLTTPGHLDNATGFNTTHGVPFNTSIAHVSRSVTIKSISESSSQTTTSTSDTSRFVSCIWMTIILAALTL